MSNNTLTNMLSITRIIIGLILIVHGAHNALNFTDYVERVEMYFTKVEYFNIPFLYHTAPYVPFEEFTLGLFICMGFFTKKALRVGVALYAFLILFMLDAEAYNLIAFHAVLVSAFLVLDFNNKYNKFTVEKIFTLPTME